MTLDQQAREHLDRGDHRGAASLVLHELGPPVLGYLQAIVRDADDARDVFQLFAEELWQALPGWRVEGSLRAFSYRIAWRAHARFRRDAWRKRRERLRTTMASRIAASIVSNESRLPGGRKDRLARLRDSLTPEEQTLLILRLDRDLSWDEVAEVLSRDADRVDPPALRKRFERLKEKLTRLAKEQGLVDTDRDAGEDG
ncbi:MAG TPA: sigma factor [Anaeromyxobacteraceae bacterium]|nr:sigma factor [Anaeromyxobacteraceae bacterium]